MALFICHWGAHFLSTICYIFILPKTHGSLNKTAAARRKVKNESAQEYAGCNVLADLIKLK
ncbi:hypothetical protein WMO64_03320, partial [Pseudoflavonifractor sp. CLA-AP-H29]